MENEDGSSSCVDCETCPPGQSLSQECGKRLPHSAMVICLSCKSGVSFSDKYDSSSCTPCSSCADDQVVLRNCTPEWDIKCEKQCYSKGRYVTRFPESIVIISKNLQELHCLFQLFPE